MCVSNNDNDNDKFLFIVGEIFYIENISQQAISRHNMQQTEEMKNS